MSRLTDWLLNWWTEQWPTVLIVLVAVVLSGWIIIGHSREQPTVWNVDKNGVEYHEKVVLSLPNGCTVVDTRTKETWLFLTYCPEGVSTQWRSGKTTLNSTVTQ